MYEVIQFRVELTKVIAMWTHILFILFNIARKLNYAKYLD